MVISAKKRLSWHSNVTSGKVLNALHQNNVILSTTDTVLGLLAPLSAAGRDQLDAIKGRQSKPYLILIGSAQQVSNFIDYDLPAPLERLMAACWPGPLTLIFKAKHTVPNFAKSSDGTVALRVPSHNALQELLKEVPGLFSTSANYTSKPVPTSLDEVDQAIIDRVAYVVSDGQATYVESAPSTILDCSHDQIRLVRAGAYPLDQLQKIVPITFT